MLKMNTTPNDMPTTVTADYDADTQAIVFTQRWRDERGDQSESLLIKTNDLKSFLALVSDSRKLAAGAL